VEADMNEILKSFTALPNIHPALVHFPVALTFTALALEAAALLFRRQAWLDRAAAALCALAAAGAGAAFITGRMAADTVGVISPGAEAVLAEHASIALWTLLVLSVAAGLRVAASIVDRARPVSRFGILRASALIGLLIASGLVGFTADLGGALVFTHGVAVAAVPMESSPMEKGMPSPQPLAVPDPGPPETRLIQGEDGSLVWRPLASDAAALGTVVEIMPQEDVALVTAGDAGDGEGLPLVVAGQALLLLPGTFGDLLAEARLDLRDFDGTAGLAHHVESPGDALLFTVQTGGGEVRLIEQAGGREDVWGRSDAEVRKEDVLKEKITLRTTSFGSHLKGFLDGQMVVHGHGSPGTSGRAGLYLNGRGTIRVISLELAPATGH